MTKTQNKCLICYEHTENDEIYHKSCLKKLFNTDTPPIISFTNEDVSSLALEYISEKRALPGVQRKLSLSLEKSNSNTTPIYRLTIIGYLGGEYILKPPTKEYPQMPELEDLTMHLANIAKIEVAQHGLIRMQEGSLAYITKRFDREGKHKIAVEDLCQISLKPTEHKYKSSSEKVAKIISGYSSNPGDDILKFFELILFSFIVGNADMHLKNFTLLTQNLKNIKLAPCYDLLATKLLIPDTIDPEELALPLNGKKSNIRKKDFHVFAENLKIPKKVVEYSISSMINCLPAWENKISQSFIDKKLKNAFQTLIVHKLEKLS